ncbi:pyridoxamine 5'-phosphate oxidase family protein [Acetobacterium bakii]|uniref:MFS transporter n=1 Tax=Acetobacterium bakii TaxID=52689 RepID=A0A0L6TXS7_9FIRM|nr:pyridoxamine 5'-phosphate oxidase family protein [Acetobacterium bakii]KNZ40360.1 hypothetical protein AKG39_17930 [Acetobacterium bakii]
MRRANRKVTELEELLEIINGSKVCRVGMVDNGKPYVIPMNFGYQVVDEAITIYLHGAQEGRKIEVMKSNSQICIEIDTIKEIVTGENGCNYSCHFESFIGNGEAVFLDAEKDKVHALDAIMKRQTEQEGFNYDKRVMAQTEIIEIRLTEYSGKKY